MIIHEFLILRGGTGTRSELNYLLSLPFFLLVFDGLSLSCPQTLLSLSFNDDDNEGVGVRGVSSRIRIRVGGEDDRALPHHINREVRDVENDES